MKVRLIEHNSENQMKYRNYDDTRTHLEIGKEYELEDRQIQAYYTVYVIKGHKFNSVCFETVEEK